MLKQRRRLLFFPAAAALASASVYADANSTQLVVFGDSLVAGYGLPKEDGFTAQLERALQSRGHDVNVTNAGVSGDTTSGGLARLEWTLDADYDAILVVLGGNDALRAVPVTTVKRNLEAILEKLAAKRMPVMLCGMMAPRNLGAQYTQEFDSIYPSLAERYDIVFYPHFLEGVATVAHLNQADGIHPNRQGIELIVNRMMPQVLEIIQRAGAT